MRAAREVSSMRRTSGSTIEWASSVAEFEGDLGDVHVSGERMLHVDDIAEDRQADHSDLRVESRNSSWGYVDPAQLLRSDIIDEGVPEVDAANGEIAVLGDDDRSVDVADLVSGPDSEDLVVVTEDEDLLPDDLVQDLGGNSGPEEDEEEEEEEEAIRRDQSEDRDLIPGSKDCCGSRCAGHKDSPHEGADCPSECTATGSSCECAHGNDETKNERRNVVVSGQWVEALQMMQEYEDEAVRRSLSKRMSRAVSKSSSCKSGKFMEGYVDRELMEACKLAMMSASVLEGRRRRSGASSKMTLLRHGEDDYADKRFM